MQKPFLLLLMFVALSGPSACVSYHEQALLPESSAKGFTSRTLHDKELQSFLNSQNATHGSWTPDRLALAATFFHGSIAVAKAEQDEIAARVETAGQRPNPILSFSPGYNSTSSGISPWLITPTLKVIIETAGKRDLRITQARAQTEAARLRVAAIAWTIRQTVRTAMLDLYAARQIGNQLQTVQLLREDELKKLQLMVEAGESSAFESNQARLSLNRARLAQHDAKKLRATAFARLATAIGIPSSALNKVTLDFSVFKSLPPDPGKTARRLALTNRADLLAALADYAAADAGLRLTVARQYPNLQLQPGYEFDQSENKWLLGSQVELPIFHQNHGPVAEAEARRKKVVEIFEFKQAAVFGEIELATAAYRTTRDKVKTATKLTEEAEHAGETTRRMVELGELAPLELTRRRIETVAAALGLVRALAEAQQALGDLEAAVQIPNQKAK